MENVISTPKKERFDNLDGLRAISCFCIVAFHIKKFSNFHLDGIGAKVVDSWTHFVPLFLLISGFGIFCGYYKKVKTQSFSVNEFYKKRYQKILPFFIIVLLINAVAEISFSNTIEAITESTLVFGLLPNNRMEVSEVAWTLGVIFLFYMLFPFICFLCNSKKSALCTFFASIALSLFCSGYFFSDKFVTNFIPTHNFLYCAPFFIGGGITYLLKNGIKKFVSRYRWICFSLCILLSIGWYIIPNSIHGLSITVLKNLIVFIPWLWYSISVNSKVLNNKVMARISRISMEIYLSQMIGYRLLEKVVGLHFAGDGWGGFAVVWVVVMAELIAGVEMYKIVESLVVKKVLKSKVEGAKL